MSHVPASTLAQDTTGIVEESIDQLVSLPNPPPSPDVDVRKVLGMIVQDAQAHDLSAADAEQFPSLLIQYEYVLFWVWGWTLL